MKREIKREADLLKDKIIDYRRDFHKYPEVGWTEYRTSSLIARRLVDLGYEVEIGRKVIDPETRMGVPDKEILDKHLSRAKEQGADPYYLEKVKGGFTGVVASLGEGCGPTIGLRFDIDALEIKEDDSAEHIPATMGFASVNEGVMHACGHDYHAAIGLGVAEILMRLKDKLNSQIKLIFQPAEEGVKGAKSMVSAGVLEDIDYIIGHHIFSGWASGEIMGGIKSFMATSKFNATIKGSPAHAGGNPQLGRNALQAASTAILNLYGIPRHSDGLTRINVGKIEGGLGRNIICDKVELVVETRGGSSKLNDYMYQKAVNILEHAAQMYDCQLKIEMVGGAPNSLSDTYLIDRVEKVAKELEDYNIIKPDIMKGSEDFAYMMNQVQNNGGYATFIGIGADINNTTYHEESDQTFNPHTSNFDIDDETVKSTMVLLTSLIFDLMTQ